LFGTAGLSAALGVRAIDRFIGGIQAGQKMLVTGASGGLGSLAVAMLASMGCVVDAASRKSEAEDFLLGLGADRVLHPSELTANSAPNLLKEEYTGAVDTLGGTVLVAALKRLSKGGAIACAGLVESQKLSLTVLPFLMRGVGLVGTGAEVANDQAQAQAWAMLETWVTEAQLERIAKVIAVTGVPAALEQMAAGSHHGRFVIQFT
jgi:alcohol dehydrogenase